MGEAKVKTAALVAAALAAVAILAVVLTGGSSHELNIRFVDAGQLVKGDLVEVAGRTVGSVDEITLTNDNQANIKLKMKDGDDWPLRVGTIAGVRAVGLSGVANRYVEITPGPEGAEEIPDGGVIRTAATRPIVDLDQVLTALDAPTRAKLKRLIKNGADVFDGNAKDANDAIIVANPAVAQANAVLSEIDRDQAAVGRLITTSATVATTLANRRNDVQGSITNTARTFEALAAERTSLQNALSRAPATLRQAQTTLRDTRVALTKTRPVLRELQPTAAPLATVLRQLPPTGAALRPVVAQLRALLPATRKGLLSVPALDRIGRPALVSTTSALNAALPIAAGLRPYTPDVVSGLFNGFTGTTAGYYDANGHYARVPPIIGAGVLSGALAGAGTGTLSTKNDARCPGAAAPPADDGSNPYIEDPSTCDPADSQK
ncbi:hypothetical protein DSM112329_01644 [Paraconexibacter sp. AEG42_29]|uniref:Mce/MlaD domain-containing protein n=1 Tax=Paraconexibacter sp. AEG42_29 TaxID=2997339 RepID=A0AAU7AT59_9ACTN